MPNETGHAYDSFVIRLWHEPATGTVLRVEIEHVQGGTVTTGRRVLPEWILDRLLACLDDPSPAHPTTSSGRVPANGPR